ncbi:mannose-1-phosphate guanylyltransferase [bacterium]|nr:mannose-1-phosphate guanylyltransferase [bacterium]
MNSHLYVLIMAGGEGTRFFPVSTPEKPKQFLSFWGDRTFIQQTHDRVGSLTKAENIYIATNERYVDLVKEQLPLIPRNNIIGEPLKKNTAPCIAFVCNLIAQKDPEAVVLVLPSDHVIEKKKEFLHVINRGVAIATEREVLLTLGIRPTWAADCYGYIRAGNMIEDDADGRWPAYVVSQFVEKPAIAVAQKYMDEGGYFWNSGMFMWQASFVLDELAKYLPKMHTLLKRYSKIESLNDFFMEADSISIDYGIMERSERVVTIPCDLGWADVGTWQSLYNLVKYGDIELDPYIQEVMEKQLF